MQPNTVNTHHDTAPPVPPELLEAVARALAAAVIPPPRRPPPPEPETEERADFLTAAQLARRLGISRETVRRLAIAGTLPHTVVCHGAARRPAGTRGGSLRSSRPAAWRQPTWPSSPPPGGRG
jgi:excisionase family DNA binding protein